MRRKRREARNFIGQAVVLKKFCKGTQDGAEALSRARLASLYLRFEQEARNCVRLYVERVALIAAAPRNPYGKVG